MGCVRACIMAALMLYQYKWIDGSVVVLSGRSSGGRGALEWRG